ncbi:MAG: dehydrogenase [Verrucomicrobia bacterium]|nr:dehydrogenase [Verrucomicrobiota bacterium]
MNLRYLSLHALSGLLLCSAMGADDYQPRNSQKPGEEPPSPQEAVAAITLPEGFKATLYAGEPDVRQPVAMALDDRGRIWVAESYSYHEWEKKGEDRIVVFEDTNNDGRHDKRTVFWTGGNHVSAMTVGWGGVWVGDAPNLLFIPDRNRDDVPDGAPEVVLDGWSIKAKHNFLSGLTWGIDGWMYGRHGISAKSLVGVPGTPEDERTLLDCSIWRFHPVSKKFEVISHGTTNPWGLDWNDVGELFFSNNVNGHLWHLIPGAYFPRMNNYAEGLGINVYERIPMCADHLHHAGSTDDWTKTRDGKGVHGKLGGGHTHCGAMIYLGGKWPEKYNNTIFMSNTHGRRLNNDSLARKGSGYVGKHEEDFMFANNQWYRGVTQLYGPDGDVYISDWCDDGECHDNDGVHRTSGRIYKITYGDATKSKPIDLWKATDELLVAYQLDKNEWFARKSRSILQQRAVAGKLDEKLVGAALKDILAGDSTVPQRIRAFLTLKVTSLLGDEDIKFALDDPSEHLRAWGVRIAAEVGGEVWVARLQDLAKSDPSALVRVYIASSMALLPAKQRWPIAQALAQRVEDREDQNIPLMLWFGLKDVTADYPVEAVALLQQAKFPVIPRSIARRLAAAGQLDPLMQVFGKLKDDETRLGVLTGMAAALKGRREVKAPADWELVMAASRSSAELLPVALRLNFIFDEAGTLAELEQTLTDAKASVDAKRLALDLVGESGNKESVPAVLSLLATEGLRFEAIKSLAAFKQVEIADALIKQYKSYSGEDQLATINTLTANPKFAGQLLDAIAAKVVPSQAVTAYHARHIQTFKNKELNKQLTKVWGKLGRSSAEKKALIKKWRDQLTPDVLAKADFKNGHLKFQQLCMACHNLKGEGGNIGPDLTGANRGDIAYMLENIIDPSATLPQDFKLTIITQKDGTVVSGNVASENEYTISLRTPAGEISVATKDVTKREVLDQSIMPEGLLAILKPDEVRDLLGFLGR